MVRNAWNRSSDSRSARRWIFPGLLAFSLLLLPAASSPAEAHDDHRGRTVKVKKVKTKGHHHRAKQHHHGSKQYGHQRDDRRGHNRGNAHDVGYYEPPRVPYHRRHHAPSVYVLPSAFVTYHGPRIDAQVVYYPRSAPVVYEPGYCPGAAHYHPYHPPPGWHGSIGIQVGF